MANKQRDVWYDGDLDWVSSVVIADGRLEIVSGSLFIDFEHGYEFIEDAGKEGYWLHRGPITDIRDLAGASDYDEED